MQKFLLFILSISFWKYGQSQLSIDACQLKARRNYPLIKQFDLIDQSTQYNLSNAGKAYLPQVNLTAIGAYIIKGLPAISLPNAPATEDSKAKLIGIAQVNQVIWDGGATRTQKEIIKATDAVEKNNIEVTLFNIKESVNQVFFGILLIDEQLKQLAILTDKLNLQFSAVKQSKDNGYAYQIDVDEVKAELLNVEQKVIEFRFARKGYTEMLGYLIGEQLSEDIELLKPVVEESVLLQPVNRPEFSLYASQRQLVDTQLKMIKIGNMPKVGFLGTGLMIQPGTKFATTTLSSLSLMGVSVSWSTENLYKTSNNKKLYALQLDKINNQEEVFRFNNTYRLKQISADVEKQQAILKKDADIVLLKEDIIKMYRLKYENGLCPMNDVITALNKEAEAKSNQALHQMQLLMSVYNHKTTSGN